MALVDWRLFHAGSECKVSGHSSLYSRQQQIHCCRCSPTFVYFSVIYYDTCKFARIFVFSRPNTKQASRGFSLLCQPVTNNPPPRPHTITLLTLSSPSIWCYQNANGTYFEVLL